MSRWTWQTQTFLSTLYQSGLAKACTLVIIARFSLIIAPVLMAFTLHTLDAKVFTGLIPSRSVSFSFLLWTRLREPRRPFCLAISARETFAVVPSIMKIQSDAGNSFSRGLNVWSEKNTFSDYRSKCTSLSGEVFSNSSVSQFAFSLMFVSFLFL